MVWRRKHKKPFAVTEGKSGKAEYFVKKGVFGPLKHSDISIRITPDQAIPPLRSEPDQEPQFIQPSLETLYGDVLDEVERPAFGAAAASPYEALVGSSSDAGTWVSGTLTMKIAADILGIDREGYHVPGEEPIASKDLQIMVYSDTDAGSGYEIAVLARLVPDAHISVVSQDDALAKDNINHVLNKASQNIRWYRDPADAASPHAVLYVSESNEDIRTVAEPGTPSVSLADAITFAHGSLKYSER